MPRKIADLTGKKFGSLTAMYFVEIKTQGNQRKAIWMFNCDCGNSFPYVAGDVRNGNKKCKCSYSEIMRGFDDVDKRIDAKRVVKENGCHEWVGRSRKGGYGVIQHKGKTYSIHRFIYAQTFGEIPEGLHVLHVCDNPRCFNIAHLRLGTHQDNMRDKMEKGRHRLCNGKRLESCFGGVKPKPAQQERKKRVYPEPNHGTDAKYRRGCRCDECRAYKKRIRKR